MILPLVDDPQTPIDPIDDDEPDEPDEPIEAMTKPATPTTSLPGSIAKIEILRRRVERGELLWHSGDMTFERYFETISENLGSIFPA